VLPKFLRDVRNLIDARGGAMPNEEGTFPIYIRGILLFLQPLCSLRLVEAFLQIFLVVSIDQLLHLLHQSCFNFMVLNLHIYIQCVKRMVKKKNKETNIIFIFYTIKKPCSQALCSRAIVSPLLSPLSSLKSIVGISIFVPDTQCFFVEGMLQRWGIYRANKYVNIY